MLNVVCINAGNYLGRGQEYVEILFDSVRRNLPAGYPGRFLCFTDDPNACDYRDGIECRPLPCKGLKGWWNKLSLFETGVFDNGDRIVYFDLDTLIIGRLDKIVEYKGDFAVLRDFYRAMLGWGGINSSVMAWGSGVMAWGERNQTLDDMWKDWNADWRPILPGGDQQWIEDWFARNPAYFKHVDILQDKYPDFFASYKVLGGKIPEKAGVVCFHGTPKPHEIKEGWVPEVWKAGGMTRAELTTVCNTNIEKLRDQVRASIAKDYPWLTYHDLHDRHAVIVGGGPSIESQVEHLHFKQGCGQDFFALNGSAAWLKQHGITPKYHSIVDARPENARFVSDPNPETTYLIASQCDQAVFDALKGHNVLLWHSHAPKICDVVTEDKSDKPIHLIGGGSTVGLSTIVIAHMLGYRKIHLFGFDSCLNVDKKDHAYEMPVDDLTVDVWFGDKKYLSCPWMVQQAQEFILLAPDILNGDNIITVEGEGLLKDMAEELANNPNPTLRASVVRSQEVLRHFNGAKEIKGAEIGVFCGEMSKMMLEFAPALHLTMVDAWEPLTSSYKTPDGAGDWHAFLTQEQQDRFQQEARNATEFANGRRRILPMRSAIAARAVQDGSLDFVFIDADHSYEGCREDIETWLPKLKPGGLLCGHDYNHPTMPFGVKKAVDEYVARTGSELELGKNMTWFIQSNGAENG